MKIKEVFYKGFKIVGKEYNYKVFRINYDGTTRLEFTSICGTVNEIEEMIDSDYE